MRSLLLTLSLLGTSAFAEAGLPSYDLCTSPPCACGVSACACGELCASGQCRPAQMGYCASDSQCGSGTCGTFVCNFNVCVASDGGVRPDAGASMPTDAGTGSSNPPGGCSTAPVALVALAAVVVKRRRREPRARAQRV
ncbi:MAG: hypothetical protein Q8N23_24625 [Archangium sp.]|nr:hypothetical protein [Archangium sp.]MDP3155880.1 hypothetical protein [Archangium sp.]MDP3575410.1 hypothetical protein [Archangium sp.]